MIRSLRERAQSLGLGILPGDGFSERAQDPIEVESGRVLYKARTVRKLLSLFKNGELIFEDIPVRPSEAVVGITVEAIDEALSRFSSEERRNSEKELLLRLAGIEPPYSEWQPKNEKVICFRNEIEDPGNSKVEMIGVRSSNVKAIGYDEKGSVLFVEFNSGSLYEHYGIPAYIFQAFLDSDSKGRFLHSHIKSVGYHYKQIR